MINTDCILERITKAKIKVYGSFLAEIFNTENDDDWTLPIDLIDQILWERWYTNWDYDFIVKYKYDIERDMRNYINNQIK